MPGVHATTVKQEDTMDAETSKVVITDISMPFLSMVLFMVKAAIAAIPAFIIPGIPGLLAAAIFDGISGGQGTV